jgi:hypothetical protein
MAAVANCPVAVVSEHGGAAPRSPTINQIAIHLDVGGPHVEDVSVDHAAHLRGRIQKRTVGLLGEQSEAAAAGDGEVHLEVAVPVEWQDGANTGYL